MAEHARTWYPRECCGLLLDRAGALELVCCANRQDEYRVTDPDRYGQRYATGAYAFDEGAVQRLLSGGAEPRLIFHSHTDHGTSRGAYFSEKDRTDAMWGEVPRWGEDCGHVVLSARADGVDDWKLFVWSGARGDFVEQT